MNKKNFRLPRYSRNKYAGRIADAYNAPVSLFAMRNTAPMQSALEPKVLKLPKTYNSLADMIRLNRVYKEKANIGFEEADRQKNILKNKEKEHAKRMSNVINYYKNILERSENDRNTLRNENAELHKNIKQFPEIQSKLDNIYKMLGYSGAIGAGSLGGYGLTSLMAKNKLLKALGALGGGLAGGLGSKYLAGKYASEKKIANMNSNNLKELGKKMSQYDKEVRDVLASL